MQYLASCAWLQARSYSAPSLAGGVKVLTGRVVASVVSFAFLSGTFPLVLKSPVVASWRCSARERPRVVLANVLLGNAITSRGWTCPWSVDSVVSASPAGDWPSRKLKPTFPSKGIQTPIILKRMLSRNWKLSLNLPVTAGTENVSRLFLKALSLGQVRQQAAEVQSDANLKTLIELLHVAEVNRDILQAQGFDASLRPR
eukprot:m.452217 g.452217  ORF g.452217 m.452217 type:complete len:200 (+) comp56926_c0_seq3:205-804(+)